MSPPTSDNLMAEDRPGSRIAKRVRPYGGETLISYLSRLQRHTYLTEKTLLAMLRYPKKSVGRWPLVNGGFFHRLARLTGESEFVLRSRLAEWSEGPRHHPNIQTRPTVHMDRPGLGCVQCRHIKDEATFTAEITQFDHICLKHKTWAETRNHRWKTGKRAPQEAVRAARTYHRARRRRHPREAAEAFNVSHEILEKIFVRCWSADLSSIRTAWLSRETHSRGTSPPSILQLAYPEIATLAVVLLGDRCTQATRGLYGLLQRVRATRAANHEFRQIADRILLVGAPDHTRFETEAMTTCVQQAALLFLDRATSETVPPREYPAAKVSQLVDTLVEQRQTFLDAGSRQRWVTTHERQRNGTYSPGGSNTCA